MINKKNLLGKTPEELGDKDAIHVAIVAVRAAKLIKPGEKCSMNENREAIPSEKGVGVADPFRKENILRGQVFWLLMNQDSVPNVQHVWEHPKVDFTPPTKEPSKNSYINEYAKQFECDYNQLIEVCSEIVEKGEGGYVLVENGKLAIVEDLPDDVEEFEDIYDLWSEWAEETGHEFYNSGSECCPEYDYPDVTFFKKIKE